MLTLASQIRRYYFDNFERLSPSRQFHFASRLAAWEGSAEALAKLRGLQDFMLPSTAETTLKALFATPLNKGFFADTERKPFFNKYPQLHGVNLMLFRARHLKEVYDIDVSQELLNIISLEELQALGNQLLNDVESLKWLSSFAINFLYLTEKLYGPLFKLDPAVFLGYQKKYSLDDPIQLHLLIYLFTHCVLADSNYYVQDVPKDRLPTYVQMLELLDKIIAQPGQLKPDVKIEYLVASRICHKASPLQDSIYKEINGSIGPDGTYIIDTSKISHNPRINSLNMSEHRNVLYVMSTSAFNPSLAQSVD